MTVGIEYEISSNSMTLYVEYFIYDAISMVGSVGGTLGMCIGFSFTGMITILINLIQNGINLIKAKLFHKILSKSNSQNGSLNKTMKISQKEEEPIDIRMCNTNVSLQMENYLKIEKSLDEKLEQMENYLKIEKSLEEKLQEKLNATKFVSLSRSLDGCFNLKNEKYPNYWQLKQLKTKMLELKKEVEGISKKIKAIEKKKNL